MGGYPNYDNQGLPGDPLEPKHDYVMAHWIQTPTSGPPTPPFDHEGCPTYCPNRLYREARRFGVGIPGKTIRQMQTEVVRVNLELGWRGEGVKEPSFPEAMMLLVTEVAEAVEAWRTNGCQDVTEAGVGAKPEGVGSEFADILIRLLDDCDLFGIDLMAEYERKIAYNRTRPYRHGGKAL